jgi:hypothetical protein
VRPSEGKLSQLEGKLLVAASGACSSEARPFPLAQDTTLLPGTVILTGTPAGVGMGLKPQRWLKARPHMHTHPYSRRNPPYSPPYKPP